MPDKIKKYVVAIAGPTAVGKSEVAIELAQHFSSEIISADSRQLFREMNIGTAKPSESQMQLVPHHFISSHPVYDHVSAGAYATQCLTLIGKLHSIHEVLFLVGGSGLYLRAVLDGLDDFPKIPKAIRDHWSQIQDSEGVSSLQSRLKELDPVYFTQVDLDNPHRLIRALSVINHTGRPYSEFLTRKKSARPFEVIRVFLNMDRPALYNRINARVEKMMQMGLEEEVRSLQQLAHLEPLNTVGYKEFLPYFKGHRALDEVIDKIKQHSRNYAKRQITWFKNQENWQEFEPSQIKNICDYICSRF